MGFFQWNTFQSMFLQWLWIIADRLRWIFEHRNDTFNRHSREVKFSSVFPRIRHTFTGLWHIQHLQKTCQTDVFSTFHLCIFVRCAKICIMKTICSGTQSIVVGLFVDEFSIHPPSRVGPTQNYSLVAQMQNTLGTIPNTMIGSSLPFAGWILLIPLDFQKWRWKLPNLLSTYTVEVLNQGNKDTGNDGQI